MTAAKVKCLMLTCDRCGREGASRKAKPVPGWGEIKARGRGEELQIGTFEPSRSATTVGDLCPECWREFQAWFSAGVKASNDDEGGSDAA